MSEELATIFENPENPEEQIQLRKEWGGEGEFVRSRSPSPTPNRFDSLSYSEEEYESEDPDYIPCYYRFCDESSEYICDDCESPLCIDHTYVKYDSENHYCTFCLTNLFNDRLTNVKERVKKVRGKMKEYEKAARETRSDVNCIYFTSVISVVALIVYNLYNAYIPYSV